MTQNANQTTVEQTTRSTEGQAIARAIASALTASLGFSIMYALLKGAGPDYSHVQLIFFRSLIALALFLPLLWRERQTVWRTNRLVGHLFRTLAGLLAMICAFYAVSRMPLSTLSAVTFTMPIFVSVMSFPLLGERVGWHRGSATVVGFIGVFIMLGPQLMGFHPVYLIALASAVSFAFAAIALRQLSAESPLTTFLYFTLTCTVLTGIPLPWVWQAPDALGWLCIIGAGITGGLAQYLLVKSYSLAPASIIAPFEYTRLLWASLIAFVVWTEVPSLRTLLGAALVIGAGWYISHREVKRA